VEFGGISQASSNEANFFAKESKGNDVDAVHLRVPVAEVDLEKFRNTCAFFKVTQVWAQVLFPALALHRK
jgi:hypothetical protein